LKIRQPIPRNAESHSTKTLPIKQRRHSPVMKAVP